jgi:flagellar basal-body rod protein FlgB
MTLPPLDTGLNLFRQVLDLRAYRQQILTADIANASTPRFKAIDLDFREALAASAPPMTRPTGLWLADDPRDLGGEAADQVAAAAAGSVKYQTGMPVTLDGNSVDLNQEKAVAGENAVQYEAAASFTAQIVRMLGVAINGSGGQTGNGSG